jgi:hypothetical protein
MIIIETEFILYRVYCIGEAATSSAFAHVLKTKSYFVRCPTLITGKN